MFASHLQVFLAQKMLLLAANNAGKPVYVTRVVDTMTGALLAWWVIRMDGSLVNWMDVVSPSSHDQASHSFVCCMDHIVAFDHPS
jgi:hypothetical protein